MMKLRTYLIFVAICCTSIFYLSCGPKVRKREKELRILFSTDEFDQQYSEERYLSYSFQNHPDEFFVAQNDTVSLAKWDILLEQMAHLQRYKPEVPDILHRHNYCSHLEIEFFDHEKSLCQLCVNPDNKTVRLNYLVYEAPPEMISFFREYISLDSAAFASSGKSNYSKKVLFNDRRVK
ncbi:MAG: hypothetical protein LBV59_16360 [Sphingobacterium sp.]|jgi:hypothetical protein|uniref:hypothetical protein n=1 Tax=Sphingobacterium sp. TaxID=341027 RepID=UPI00283E80B2|nr:hypothetical protein [Sphingobacterium sp.]MDR3009509.1 hypothetical protein [Sphingobacterium sp.]